MIVTNACLARIAWGLMLLAAAGTAQIPPPAATATPARRNTYSTQGLFGGGPPRVSPEVHADRRITFQFTAPKAAQVNLLFGEWNVKPQPMARNEKGVWSITIGPVEPEIYSYMFQVDGVQTIDLANPRVKAGTLVYGNVVEVPGTPPRYDEVQNVAHGAVEIRQYLSTPLKRARSVYIYLPPEYDSAQSRRFPVLYLRHGGGDDEGSWLRDGRAAVIADNLLAQHKAAPMVIVMTNGMTDGSWAGGSTPQALEMLEKELMGDVIPLVEKRYRVLAGRENRAITGLSMGGGQAFVFGLKNLDQFAWVGEFSAGLLSGTELNLDALAPGVLEDGAIVNRRLKLFWIGCGTEDTRCTGHLDLGEERTRRGIHTVFRTTPGGHEWKVWRHQLAEFLQALFQAAK
jgi:enterochelin esterase-like enzyme